MRNIVKRIKKRGAERKKRSPNKNPLVNFDDIELRIKKKLVASGQSDNTMFMLELLGIYLVQKLSDFEDINVPNFGRLHIVQQIIRGTLSSALKFETDEKFLEAIRVVNAMRKAPVRKPNL